MFYSKLNINGVEYKLHATLTGEGPPPETLEADVGMRYMDTISEAYYKRTNDGWKAELVGETTEADSDEKLDACGVSYLKFKNDMGDIDSALDSIIAMQEALIGGESV